MYVFLLLTCLWAAGLQTLRAQPVTTRVDRETSVISYTGSATLHDFTGVSRHAEGTLVLDLAQPGRSRIEVSAPVASFDSGNGIRDGNMRDAVEADRYPDVRFVSTDVEAAGGVWNVRGRLTFHGQTHPVTVPVTVRTTDATFEAEGAFDVSLTQFGVRRPKLLFTPIGDVIRVAFTVRAPLPPPPLP